VLRVTEVELEQHEEESQRAFAELRKSSGGIPATGTVPMRRGRFLIDRALELHALYCFWKFEGHALIAQHFYNEKGGGAAGIITEYLIGSGPPPAYSEFIEAILRFWNGSDGSLYKADVRERILPSFNVIAVAIARRIRSLPDMYRLCLDLGVSPHPRYGVVPQVPARLVNVYEKMGLFAFFTAPSARPEVPASRQQLQQRVHAAFVKLLYACTPLFAAFAPC
jgi:hypothetical protein